MIALLSGALAITGSGCSSDPEPDNPAEDAPPECVDINGRPVQDSDGCFGPEEHAGCSTKECEPSVVVFGKDSKDVIWKFVNGCIPDGWTEILEEDVPAQAFACDPKTSPADCGVKKADSCGVSCDTISGQLLDDEAKCWGTSAPVACANKEAECPEQASLALDKQGNTWQLDTDCLPPGWTALPSDPDTMGSPACEE